MINEQSDPNLAETPHYKEKQTILPNPITIDHITGEKKLSTPLKRSHDGRPKKPLKFPDSPIINDDHHSDRVLLTDKKSDDAKIDMRKLIVEPKHRKRSTSSSGHKIHSSTSSSSHSCSKEKHRGSSSSDHHRSSSNKSSKHRDEHRKSSSNHSSSSSKSKQNPSDVRQSQEHQQQPLLSATSTTQSIVSVPAESIIIEHPMELNAVNHVPLMTSNDHLKAIICPPEPSTEQIIEIETVTSPPQLMDMMSMDSIIDVSSAIEPEIVETCVTEETTVVAPNAFHTEPEFQTVMTFTPTQPLTPVTPKIKKNIMKTPSSVSKPPQPDLLSSILAGMDNTPNRNNASSGSSSF